jgi:hypothetical protein
VFSAVSCTAGSCNLQTLPRPVNPKELAGKKLDSVQFCAQRAGCSGDSAPDGAFFHVSSPVISSIVHPSRNEILNEHRLLGRDIGPFARRIIEILQEKYDRHAGSISGAGKKFI